MYRVESRAVGLSDIRLAFCNIQGPWNQQPRDGGAGYRRITEIVEEFQGQKEGVRKMRGNVNSEGVELRRTVVIRTPSLQSTAKNTL